MTVLSMYGVNHKRDGGNVVVMEIIIAQFALVKRINLAGLADQIDLLKDRHAMAMRNAAQDRRASLNHFLEGHQ